MDKLNMHTPNLADENYRKLAALFPNAVTESIDPETGEVVRSIDADVLRQEISGRVVEGREERYQFTWPDKKKAMLAANAPIAATLRPVREDSVGRDGTPGGWNSENLYIEGDNLDVLKMLQETYLHKIDVIYIDPPYNTGNNLIYRNNFYQTTDEYLASSGEIDDEGNLLTENLETNGRFHTDWLNMLYPRLSLAKNLLSEAGVLIIAIDQSEVNTLGLVLQQLFSNREITLVTIVHNPSGTQGGNFSYCNEYAYFVYDGSIRSIAYEKRDEKNADVRSFMNGAKGSAGTYLRTTGYHSFYPILIRGEEVIGFGDVVPKEVHPSSSNVTREDGIIEVYPIDQDGVERKWLFARETVESVRGDLHVKYNSRRSCYEIIRIKSEINYKTVWTDAKYSAKTYGTQLLNSLLDCPFTFPKSLYTVQECLSAAMHDKNTSIILDFFSGSATTAHAVMNMNACDGGRRKFIMVQLPESVEDSVFFNICEIGKERIRRAGRKIKEEAGLTAQNLDIGFRVLRLDSSNMQDVYYNPAAMTQDLLSVTTDNIKPDRTPEDLLFQVMLDLGVELSSPITETVIGGKKVFDVADGFLLACFDTGVTTETVTAIAKKQPFYAVFRDSSMADDSTATNFDQIFETYSHNTVRKVL